MSLSLDQHPPKRMPSQHAVRGLLGEGPTSFDPHPAHICSILHRPRIDLSRVRELHPRDADTLAGTLIQSAWALRGGKPVSGGGGAVGRRGEWSLCRTRPRRNWNESQPASESPTPRSPTPPESCSTDRQQACTPPETGCCTRRSPSRVLWATLWGRTVEVRREVRRRGQAGQLTHQRVADRPDE